MLFNFCVEEMNKIDAKRILIIHTCKRAYGDLLTRHRNFAKKGTVLRTVLQQSGFTQNPEEYKCNSHPSACPWEISTGISF